MEVPGEKHMVDAMQVRGRQGDDSVTVLELVRMVDAVLVDDSVP